MESYCPLEHFYHQLSLSQADTIIKMHCQNALQNAYYLHYLHTILVLFGGDERSRSIRTHAPCVQTLVPVQSTLVVLCIA